MYRVAKLRFRRKVRNRRKQVEGISSTADESFNRHFINRLLRLVSVRRFVSGWLVLVIILSGLVIVQTRNLKGYYQELKPASGGTFTEGLVGSFTNANPLFASTMVDNTVSKLIFAGLLTYDEDNKLVGDLAETWEVNETGTIYTVKLKDKLLWQDGRKLTADDVVFTFESAQNPDVKSKLFQIWREVTIKKVDNKTVQFTLKNPFAPFIYSLTTGIIPKHVLESVVPTQLRTLSFNTIKPVGAGPFKMDIIEVTGNKVDNREQQIGLVANDNFHLGKPKLNKFVVRAFVSTENLNKAFKNRTIEAMVGLEKLPDDSVDKSVVFYETPITAINMAFFLTDSGPLADKNVRSALLQGADIPQAIKSLGYPVIKSDEPFIKSSFAYNPAYRQLPKNIEQSEKLLNDAGWIKVNNFRQKDAKELKLLLIGLNNYDNTVVAKSLQQSWEKLGILVEVVLQDDEDLQTAIANRAYDVLLNAVSLGLDPDSYSYWHSSQMDPRSPTRLNFSNYKSEAADKALDAGRTRIDASLRVAKYEPFLEAWKNDVPAMALYQPRFLYMTRGQIFNYNPSAINTSTDRLNNVHNWMIRQENILKK